MKLTISMMIAHYQLYIGLIRNQCVCCVTNVCRLLRNDYNLKRHFTTKHGDFGNFLQEGFGCYKIKY